MLTSSRQGWAALGLWQQSWYQQICPMENLDSLRIIFPQGRDSFLAEKDHNSEVLKLSGQPGREVSCLSRTVTVPRGTAGWMPYVPSSPPWPRFPAGQHLSPVLHPGQGNHTGPVRAERRQWDGKLNRRMWSIEVHVGEWLSQWCSEHLTLLCWGVG